MFFVHSQNSSRFINNRNYVQSNNFELHFPRDFEKQQNQNIEVCFIRITTLIEIMTMKAELNNKVILLRKSLKVALSQTKLNLAKNLKKSKKDDKNGRKRDELECLKVF